MDTVDHPGLATWAATSTGLARDLGDYRATLERTDRGYRITITPTRRPATLEDAAVEADALLAVLRRASRGGA